MFYKYKLSQITQIFYGMMIFSIIILVIMHRKYGVPSTLYVFPFVLGSGGLSLYFQHKACKQLTEFHIKGNSITAWFWGSRDKVHFKKSDVIKIEKQVVDNIITGFNIHLSDKILPVGKNLKNFKKLYEYFDS